MPKPPLEPINANGRGAELPTPVAVNGHRHPLPQAAFNSTAAELARQARCVVAAVGIGGAR